MVMEEEARLVQCWFSCAHEQEQPLLCKGNIQWQILPLQWGSRQICQIEQAKVNQVLGDWQEDIRLH